LPSALLRFTPHVWLLLAWSMDSGRSANGGGDLLAALLPSLLLAVEVGADADLLGAASLSSPPSPPAAAVLIVSERLLARLIFGMESQCERSVPAEQLQVVRREDVVVCREWVCDAQTAQAQPLRAGALGPRALPRDSLVLTKKQFAARSNGRSKGLLSLVQRKPSTRSCSGPTPSQPRNQRQLRPSEHPANTHPHQTLLPPPASQPSTQPHPQL
jgi:hypothetical protein